MGGDAQYRAVPSARRATGCRPLARRFRWPRQTGREAPAAGDGFPRFVAGQLAKESGLAKCSVSPAMDQQGQGQDHQSAGWVDACHSVAAG